MGQFRVEAESDHDRTRSRSREGRRSRRQRSFVSRALAGNGEVIASWLLIAAVTGSAQAVGAVHVPVLLVVAGIGLLACAIAYRARLVSHWLIPIPVAIFLALAGYTLLQALPLPAGVLAGIAPATAEVWQGALAPLAEPGPRWASISLDPGASVIEALKWVLYAAIFATAAIIGARRGAHWGALVVFISGVLVALSALGHRLVGATHVWGLYEPVGEFGRDKIGPILNPNNLSGYLNIGIFSGFGLLIMRRPPAARWLLGLGVATQLGALVEAGSRGGLLSFALGIAALATVLVIARRKQAIDLADPTTVRAVVGTVLVGGVTLALLALRANDFAILGEKNVEKIKLLSWAKPMLGDHPVFGIGRGAFESVFPHYRVGLSNMIYSHPENFVAQWVCEWGLPVGLAALLALGWALRPRTLGVGQEAVAIGAFAALIVLLVQNLVDLGLEVPAIPIATATTLGACWGATQVASARSRKVAQGSWVVRVAWVVVVGGGMLIATSAYFGWRTVGDDRRKIRDALEAFDLGKADVRARLRGDLRAAMLRHPAEPYFSRIGAFVAWRGGDQNPLPWIDRALERGLTIGRTHYLLAQILASGGRRSQALLEVRFAVEYDPDLAKRGAHLATQISRDPEELARAAAPGKGTQGFLEEVARLLDQPEQWELREKFLQHAITKLPDSTSFRSMLASDLIDSLETKKRPERCAEARRAECLALIEKQQAALARLAPDSFEPLEIKARLLLATGKAHEVEPLLAGQCERFRMNRRCTRLRLTAATKGQSEEGVMKAARAIAASGCETPSACAETYESLGDTMANTDNWAQARAYYQRAAQEEPSAKRWTKVAEAASRTGAHLEAADALARAARERGANSNLRARIEEERRRALLRQVAPK